MTRAKILEFLRATCYEGVDTVVLIDGHDNAFVGLRVEENGIPHAVYSEDQIVQNLAENMPYREAVEWFEFNIEDAHVGIQSPTFIRTII